MAWHMTGEQEKSGHVAVERKISSGYPSTPRLVAAIRELRAALTGAYGVDYAFSVMGKGHRIAAENYVDGVVLAYYDSQDREVTNGS